MTRRELIAELAALPVETLDLPVYIDTGEKYHGTDFTVFARPLVVTHSVAGEARPDECVVIESEETE